MIRTIVLSVLLIVVVAALSLGGRALLVALREEPEVVEPPRAVMRAEAQRLAPTTVVARVEGFGTARADRLARLSAQVSGQVIALADGLREGAEFEADALLVRIDARDYRAQVARAESQLAAERALRARVDVEDENLAAMIATAESEWDVAQREYGRIRDLLEEGTSSERELDAARVTLQRAKRSLQELQRQRATIPQQRAQLDANIQQRQAELELARLNLERCEIRAPFAGRIEKLAVEVGEQVAPGQMLLTLLDPSLIEVPIELPISQRSRVSVGAPVSLYLESQPAFQWKGTVERIAPSADASTRTFALYVEVAATTQPQPLLPGMFVRALIDGPTLRDVLLVPRNAVRSGHIYVLDGDQVWRRVVTVDQHLQDRTVITGLEPGEVVITSNLDALFDGAHVAPVFAGESDTAAPALAAEESVDHRSADTDSTP